MCGLTRYLLICLALAVSSRAQADPPALQEGMDAARLYSLAAREAQHQALSAMSEATVQYGPYGRLRKVEGRTGIYVPDLSKMKRGDSAATLFQKVSRILMASGSESFVIRNVEQTPQLGGRGLFLDQTIDGIPVVDARVNLLVDSKGEVVFINSLFVPARKANTTPAIAMEVARAAVELNFVESDLADEGSVEISSQGSLAFWTDGGKEQTPRLLWMFNAQYENAGQPQLTRFGVDATTGDIRYSEQRSFALNRKVHTNNYVQALATPQAGTLLWTEGNPNSSNPQALSIYNRVVEPINRWAGVPLAYDVVGLVAQWGVPGNTVSASMLGTDFRFYLFFNDSRASDDDAIAHEYGHGMFVPYVPHMPPIWRYWEDWWSANEFYGDLSTVLTHVIRFNDLDDAAWAITDLRDWKNPQSKGLYNDWYPHRYFRLPVSGLGYANSTIFGHGVYLMLKGGQHGRAGQAALGGPIPTFSVTPAQPQQIQRVLAEGLRQIVVNNEQFTAHTYRHRTIAAANALYPGTTVSTTVANAWTAVGIDFNCTAPPPQPVVQIVPQYCRGKHDIFWGPIPNAKYHGQAVAQQWAWESLMPTTIVDGGSTSCFQNVSTRTKYRMRACNACGCSAWTPDEWMDYYNTCQ